ncbi:hypothetical protein OEZ86_003326 [Tetradesmus obliquus]|nr:hypothetical protein OEZ86_003326 [Tetradesmus obliquus]
MDRAGAISWLSSPVAPGFWRDRNLINVWDQGRLLQQSFYGCVDGSCWATNPWLWNPVQGGSWENEPGVTLKKDVKPSRLYVQGHPRNWGKQDLIKSVLLTSDITLKDNYGILKFAMKYTGKVTHPYMTQEVPALFVHRRFSVLAYYQGSRPWTSDKAITYAFPPGRNIYARPTEHWAAFVDPATGFGVGLFNPLAWHGITAYRIGEDGSDLPWDCSYFAHTIRMQLHVNMRQYNYTVYVTTGKLDEIRATFNKLRLTPGVMPSKSAAAPTDAAADAACASCLGQPTLGRNPVFGVPANYSAFDNVEAEPPRSEPSGSSSSSSGGSAAAAATVVVGGAGQGAVSSPASASGLLVQIVGGLAGSSSSSSSSNASDASGSEGKAAVSSGSTTGSVQGGTVLLGAGEQPRAAAADAASRASAGAKTGGGTDGRTVAGGTVAAFVGCALLAGVALAVMRSKRLEAHQYSSSGGDGEHCGQAAAADGSARQGAAAIAAAAGSPVAATGTPRSAAAASPAPSPGVLTRSRAALASAQGRPSDA